MLGMRFGADPRWCSYRQALTRGWPVHRGETGTRIYFYKRIARGARTDDRATEGEGGEQRAFFRCSRPTRYSMQAKFDGIPDHVPPNAGDRSCQEPVHQSHRPNPRSRFVIRRVHQSHGALAVFEDALS
jgi:antirestriction protein ArdC